MEVKQAEVGTLCNCEVLTLMNQLKDSVEFNSKSGNQFATLVYEASQYLQNVIENQTEQDVKNLLTALLHFPVQLTRDEKLMIVNTPPRTALELSLILHNYDERLNEEEVDKLLNIVAATCP